MLKFYEDLQTLLDSTPHHNIKTIMADFNAKVGQEAQLSQRHHMMHYVS